MRREDAGARTGTGRISATLDEILLASLWLLILTALVLDLVGGLLG